jgi:hypothetical protein
MLLFWLFAHPDETVRRGFRFSLDIFFILHLGLHILFNRHEENRFDNPFSMLLITTMAVIGLLHLLALFLSQ